MSGFGIGQAVRRREDHRFLTGAGSYVGDITRARAAHMCVIYSDQAHADIFRIGVKAALESPGVLAVLTGQDAENEGLGGLPPYFMPEDAGGPPGFRTVRPILVPDRVRCVGDRVVAVVAETADQARDAAECVEIEYSPRPCVTTPDGAAASDAPEIWPGCEGNRSFTMAFGDPERTDEAFARSAFVVQLDLRNNRLSANSIEPRCALGEFIISDGEGQYILHTSSQNPHGVRKMLANSVLAIPETCLRVISPDVGGGFGMKADPYPEDALVLWAARKLGRPVRWVANRSESLAGDNHGRDQVASAQMAFDENGRAIGLRVRAYHALGAYVASATVAPITFSMCMLPGVYAISAIDVRTSAMFTNCSPTGPYRGAGRPEACFMLERLMDEAGRVSGLGQVEIRRRNLIAEQALPYTTPTGLTYDSGDFAGMMEKCLELADWDSFAARKRASEGRGLVRGRAVTCYIESAGVFNERMELRFDPSGGVSILAGTHSHGQGHATAFAQLIHDWLGVPSEQIRHIQGDTDAVAFGRGTYAARSSMLASTALRAAADEAIARCSPMAASILEADLDAVEFSEGLFRAKATNRTVSLQQVVRGFFTPVGVPGGQSLGLSTVGTAGGEAPNFPNGAHVCEVEVDPETGAIRIDRYTVVDDVGKAINPMICEGQIIGGIAQGLGQALVEEVVYDPATGQLLSGSFSDYGMLRTDTMPTIAARLEEIPCKTNPVGVKGVGESGTIAAPPTVVNAVLDALRPLGVTDLQMPLTSARIWSAINGAASRKAEPA